MKKTLLAAALLAGFAGAASAQSSVTMYGILDAGIAYKKLDYNGNSINSFGLAYGTQSGNRWGLRGVEDMGNGNRLTFQLENGFEIGNGTLGQSGRLFGRQAWFGVENDAWGYARIGRQYNLATDYFGAIDPFAQGFGQLNLGTVMGSVNTYRMSNALKYQTPLMSGFQAGIAYSFATGYDAIYAQEAATSGSGYNYETSNNTRQLSLGAKYQNGPIYVAASYDKLYGSNVVSPEASPSEWNIGGTYDFNVVKIAAAYGQTRGGWMAGQANQGNSGSALGIGGTPAGANVFGNGGLLFNSNWGVNSYMLGATVPVGAAGKVLASWGMARPNGNMQDSVVGSTNMNTYNLAYTYDFTKRTNLYAYVSYANNYATIDGLNSTVVGLGLRHQF